MEDDFEIPSKDTIPIATASGETTPLKGSLTRPSKAVEKVSTEGNHQKTDSVGKYKNLESDTFERNEQPKLGDVRLQFAPRREHQSSTWSLNSSTASTTTTTHRWYRHPKVREHWKVVAASFVLFFIGICLCVVGIVLEALQVQLSGIFMLFVIGVVCFIPGVYHVIAVYYAVKGKRGFSFYNLPLFN
uniref:transmembrane protein 134 isoform X1 n=1 Tax=Ciona intestinalis TaxID=7719 RepID=UPI000180C61D|nr:transmembrane protein 134 isoform X1 [Ciona intestinalis]|eukprot:XP_009860093.1 transmembrane protein 134 isoform X1 [Ciona intestinalis]